MVPPNSKSVLLLEDDQALLDLIPKVLTQAGMKVAKANSIAGATQRLLEGLYGVMICDLSVIGGEAAFGFISAVTETYPRMSILIITGNVSEHIRSQAQIHHIEIMEKPFAPPDLVSRIKQLLESQAA